MDVLVSHVVGQLIDTLQFSPDSSPPREDSGTLWTTFVRSGYLWVLEVDLGITQNESLLVRAQFVERPGPHETTLLWTGSEASNEGDWHLIRDEIIDLWIQRGLGLHASSDDSLSGEDTDGA
jgi:hypothetical protein